MLQNTGRDNLGKVEIWSIGLNSLLSVFSPELPHRVTSIELGVLPMIYRGAFDKVDLVSFGSTTA